MVFMLVVSVLFSTTPYLPYIGGRYHWAGKIKMASASIPLMSQQWPHFSPRSKAKANYKRKISGKLVTSGISDVAIASVHSEKTRPKKMIMIIIISITEKPFTSK